jgi:uncharacterized protein with GYD domain
MPKYMVVLSYSAEGFKALEKSTARGRREWIGAALERVGGKLESLYFTADEADLIAIYDVPDTTTATGIMLAASILGTGRVRVTPLLTAEQLDGAFEKGVSYRSAPFP